KDIRKQVESLERSVRDLTRERDSIFYQKVSHQLAQSFRIVFKCCDLFPDDEQATLWIVVVMISGEGFDQIRVAFARRDAANHQDVGHAVSVSIQHVKLSRDGLKLLDVMKGRNDETSLFSSAMPQ